MDRILSAPEPMIRAVLVALCDDDRLRARCHAHLDQLDKHHAAAAAPPPPGRSSISPGSDPSSGVVLGKRKLSSSCPPQICIQCTSAFSPDANHPEACLHHDGRLVASADEADLSAWSCCGGAGTRPGCARGLHVAIRGEHKRLSRRRSGQDPDLTRTFEGKVLRANEFVNENRWDGSDGSEVLVDGDPPSGAMTDHDDDDDNDDDDATAVVGDDDISEKTERDSGGGSDSQDEGG